MERAAIRLIHAVSQMALLIGAAVLAGCNTVPYEKGAIWCNEPLRYGAGVHFDKRHLDVARRGYIYALAAAYVLQSNSCESKTHWFNLPARLKEVDSPERDSSGFEVKTFELRESPEDAEPSQIIIAYTGSNDSADWIFTNLFFSKTQYDLAKSYLQRVVAQHPGKPIVVTGFSLGAALAAHVTKDKSTRKHVKQAWLFNPSPKTYANNRYDERIWIGALRGEALHLLRNEFMETVWPGIQRIGAPSDQDAEDYYLISAFPIYGHYRWALMRNILFVAEYAHLNKEIGPVDSRRKNEPREILEASSFKACEREAAWRHQVLRNQRANQEKVSASLTEAESKASAKATEAIEDD